MPAPRFALRKAPAQGWGGNPQGGHGSAPASRFRTLMTACLGTTRAQFDHEREGIIKKESRAVTRWDPFSDLERFHPWSALSDWRQRMDEVFGESARVGMVAPAVDVTESDGQYLFSAEVPGVKKGDLTVEVQDRVLTIRGEKKSEREETKDKARHLERSYGAFSRSFTLPADADDAKVDASFEDGVLKIAIAKRPEAKPQQVAIKG